MIRTKELYDLSHTLASEYLAQYEYPWQALDGIGKLILALGAELGEEYREISPKVWVHKDATIAPTAYLSGPCIIGARTEVRHCAYIRENVLVGADAIIGNSVEVKNAILFDWVQVPHFNYVGDSILGYKSHLGAGSVTSNFKSDESLITIRDGHRNMETGMQKIGAFLGDFVEVGCNSVLNPGTVVGRNTTIYPTSCVRGVVPERHIWKTGGVLVKKEPR